MADDQRTETYSYERRRYQLAAAIINGLGIGGTGTYLPMLPAQASFTLGRASTCSLRAERKYLAQRHAQLERLEDASCVRVTNISDGKNDIVFRGEVAKQTFILQAGDWFEIGDSRYIALSGEMLLTIPDITEIVGLERPAKIEELLITAATNTTRHIFLTGERGCDQERLGRVIHNISPRRTNPFYAWPKEPRFDGDARQLIRDCCGGTLLVHLHERGALSQRLVNAIIDPDAKLRLIICAPTRSKIESSFPLEVMNHATEISLIPLRERRNELPSLMDQWCVEMKSPVRFDNQAPEVRDALMTHDWPRNLRDFKQSVEYIVCLYKYGSTRQVEAHTQFTRSMLRTWMARLGIPSETWA